MESLSKGSPNCIGTYIRILKAAKLTAHKLPLQNSEIEHGDAAEDATSNQRDTWKNFIRLTSVCQKKCFNTCQVTRSVGVLSLQQAG